MVADNLLAPQVVAVVGASASPGKLGHTILKNAVDSGFAGTLYPVNPRGGEIMGYKAYPSIGDLPSRPDLCVIITPAVHVPGIVTQCVRADVPLAVIISGGFAETGPEGAAAQEELLSRAREGNIRLIGPNCQGLNLPHLPLCVSWPLITRPGRIAVISQSGTIGAELMDRLQQDGMGFSAFVSLGNRADLDESDFIRFFNKHSETEAIALYLEGIKDGAGFRQAVESTEKPLIVLKAGRTSAGRKAVVSHTRSLAGRYEISRSFFRQSGILTADSIDDLYYLSRAAAYLKPPRGRRLMILTSSGGSGVMAVDKASELGFLLPPLTEEIKRHLRPVLPANAIISNPLDFTGDAAAEHYYQALSILKGAYDYFMVIFGDPIPGAAVAVSGFENIAPVCLGGGSDMAGEISEMTKAGLPVFPSPETAVRCLAALSGMV